MTRNDWKNTGHAKCRTFSLILSIVYAAGVQNYVKQ